jgi:single-strand DNA-binding protein
MSTTATIVGNLTRDPELRVTPSGKPVASLGIAHTPRRNNNGTWEDMDPEFYDVDVWGTLGENVADSLVKGNRVIVVGRLRFSQWETDTGDKRNKVSITAEFCGPDLTWYTATPVRAESGEKKAASPKRDESPFASTPVDEETF